MNNYMEKWRRTSKLNLKTTIKDLQMHGKLAWLLISGSLLAQLIKIKSSLAAEELEHAYNQ